MTEPTPVFGNGLSLSFSKAKLRSKDGQRDLSQLCCWIVSSTTTEGTTLDTRWSASQDQYDGSKNSSGTGIEDGVEERPVNLVAPRIDAANDAISASNLSQKPYCQIIPLDKDIKRADALEKGIQDVCDQARFGEWYRQIIKDAQLRGASIGSISFMGTGFEFENVHPNDFRVYPKHKPWFDKTEFVGHRMRITRAEVEDLVRAKKFQKPRNPDGTELYPAQLAAFTGNPNPRADIDGEDVTFQGATRDLDLIQLWDCKVLLRVGDERQWWRIVIHQETQAVLLLERWPYSHQGYVVCYLDIDPDRFWPNTSTAWRLQNLQYAYTDAWSLMMGGVEMEAFPVALAPVASKEKLIDYKPGQIIVTASSTPVQMITGRANPSVPASVIPMLEQQADSAIRVAKTGIAQEPAPGTTATATLQQAEGQKRAEGSMSDRAALALEQSWAMLVNICRCHPGELARAYPYLSEDFFEGLADAENMKVSAASRALSANPSVYRQVLVDFWTFVNEPSQAGLWDIKAIGKMIAESFDLQFDISQFWQGDQDESRPDTLGDFQGGAAGNVEQPPNAAPYADAYGGDASMSPELGGMPAGGAGEYPGAVPGV